MIVFKPAGNILEGECDIVCNIMTVYRHSIFPIVKLHPFSILPLLKSERRSVYERVMSLGGHVSAGEIDFIPFEISTELGRDKLIADLYVSEFEKKDSSFESRSRVNTKAVKNFRECIRDLKAITRIYENSFSKPYTIGFQIPQHGANEEFDNYWYEFERVIFDEFLGIDWRVQLWRAPNT